MQDGILLSVACVTGESMSIFAQFDSGKTLRACVKTVLKTLLGQA